MENEPTWRKGRRTVASAVRYGAAPQPSSLLPKKEMVLMAGLLYLGVILFGMFAQVTRMGMIVPGDAAATADNIIASGGMLEVAFVSDMLMQTCYVMLGLTCYAIFKSVDRPVALMMVAFVVISGAFAYVNLLHVLDAVQLVSGVAQATAAEADMVLSHLNLHADGGYLAQILGWGPWLMPLGYLSYRSGYVPRTIGVVLIIGGLGLTIQGMQYFLWPSMGDLFAPIVLLSMIGEFSICGWFLFRGMKGFGETAEKGKEVDPSDAGSSM